MEKRELVIYLYLGILILGAFLVIYFFNLQFTGLAILGQYTTEADCVNAGYTWENLTGQNCTNVTNCANQTINCEPCLAYENLNATNETNASQGACISWSSCIAQNCTSTQQCVVVITGGQCVGEICDSENLNLCSDETNCSNAGGYWYDNSCNEQEQEEQTTEEETEEETEIGENQTAEEESITQIPVQQTPEVQSITDLSLQTIETSTLNPLDSKNFNLIVKNIGNVALTGCILTGGGNYASWLSIPDTSQNLNVGEEKNFAFSMNVPANTDEGIHAFSLSVQCAEILKNSEFSVNVIKKRVEFNITSVERTRLNRVVVTYSLQELLNESQNVSLQFFLFNSSDQQVVNISENQTLLALESDEFDTNIPINASLEGNLTLTANLNSEKYSVSVKEPIVLGTPTGFFALGDDLGTTGNVVAIAILVIVIIGIYFFLKRKKIPKKVSA
jgi:hypothetical protein